MKNKIKFLVIPAYVFVTACSHTDVQEVTEVTTLTTTKDDRIKRKNTVKTTASKRGGAAIRQNGLLHVLSNKPVNDTTEHLIGALDTMEEAFSDGKEEVEGKSYSHYEMSRWDRFCNKGKAMDEKDWLFVQSNNYVVPVILQGSCNQPDGQKKDYITAWNNFCSGSTDITETQRSVVRSSVKPYSIKNCIPLRAYTTTKKHKGDI